MEKTNTVDEETSEVLAAEQAAKQEDTSNQETTIATEEVAIQTNEATEAAQEVETEKTEEEIQKMSLANKIEIAEKYHAKSNAHQKMNLPNKLTLLRIILVPVMVALFYIGTATALASMLCVFIIASITDFLDGHIARKNNIVTDFGKFLDPIADKLLVVTALVLIVSSNIVIVPYVAEVSLIIVIAREFAISGLRLIAANNGTVIAADKLGKLKTVTQIVAIILLMLSYTFYTFMLEAYMAGASLSELSFNVLTILAYAGTIVYIISTIICIISGISYLVKNRAAFMLSK